MCGVYRCDFVLFKSNTTCFPSLPSFLSLSVILHRVVVFSFLTVIIVFDMKDSV